MVSDHCKKIIVPSKLPRTSKVSRFSSTSRIFEPLQTSRTFEVLEPEASIEPLRPLEPLGLELLVVGGEKWKLTELIWDILEYFVNQTGHPSLTHDMSAKV